MAPSLFPSTKALILLTLPSTVVDVRRLLQPPHVDSVDWPVIGFGRSIASFYMPHDARLAKPAPPPV